MAVAVSFEQFANELKAFDDRKVIKNQIRRDMRKPLPDLRRAVRASAMSTLPSRGGLNAWIARARLTVIFKDAGRAAGLRVKVSRKAGDGDKADLKALDDAGSIRHPLYGNRRFWYPQGVPAGFFSKAWEDFRSVFIKAADDALDTALEVIRRG